MQFIGRKKELKLLNDIYLEKRWHVGVISGARRIGKSTLIKESLKNYKSIYFLAFDTSEIDNRIRLSKKVNLYFDLPKDYVYPSFSDIFDLIIEEMKKRTIIFVIDELPFLARHYPGVISLLQEFIDDMHATDSKLLLSGSDETFLANLILDKAKPLYLRQSFKLQVGPLDFYESLEFLLGASEEDKIKYLALFYGRPFYLENIDTSLGFEENIKKLIFAKNGPLNDIPRQVLPFSAADNTTYKMILYAISKRKNKPTLIADLLNDSTNNISTYLNRLLSANIIEKRTMFNSGTRKNYYVIKDPLVRFYYDILFEHLEELSFGMGEILFETLKEEIHQFIARSFEDVANEYIKYLNINGLLPNYFGEIKELKIDNSILKHSVEFDGVSLSLDKKSILIIESKYRNKDVSLEIYKHLKENAKIFSNYKNIYFYIVSKTKFSVELTNIKDKNLFLVPLLDRVSK